MLLYSCFFPKVFFSSPANHTGHNYSVLGIVSFLCLLFRSYHTLHYTCFLCHTIHYTTPVFSVIPYTTLHLSSLSYHTLHYTCLLCHTIIHYTTPVFSVIPYTTLHLSFLLYNTLHYICLFCHTIHYNTLVFSVIDYNTPVFSIMPYTTIHLFPLARPSFTPFLSQQNDNSLYIRLSEMVPRQPLLKLSL